MSESADDREEISGQKTDEVHAHAVSIRQSSVGSVTTEQATIEQSSVRQLETSSGQFDQSSVFRMKAENAVLSHSAASFVDAQDVRLVKSNALVVRGASNAIEGDLKTVLHIGSATGNVHMIFDRESALGFGFGLGAALVGLGVVVRKLFK